MIIVLLGSCILSMFLGYIFGETKGYCSGVRDGMIAQKAINASPETTSELKRLMNCVVDLDK